MHAAERERARPPFWRPTTLIATFGGIGYLPKAPGTWGSLAALPLAWIIQAQFGAIGVAMATGVALFAGVWASNAYIGRNRRADPSEIVIDEVAGQWAALVLAPLSLEYYLAGFLAFRLLDIWKPGPIGLLERELAGGMSIMADDVAAGIAVLLGLYGLSFLL